jgi:hypothetical protein
MYAGPEKYVNGLILREAPNINISQLAADSP